MSSNSNGWIGVDLDGTLARYDGWVDELHIGEPVPLMLQRVKDWLAQGHDVRIFTARIAAGNPRNHDGSLRNIEATRSNIEDWVEKHVGVRLPVTNLKDFAMIELWDDRAVQVIPNTGCRADTSMTPTEKVGRVIDGGGWLTPQEMLASENLPSNPPRAAKSHLQQFIADMDLKFKSGNDVSVERTSITYREWCEARSALLGVLR